MIPHLYRKQPQIFLLSMMGEKFGVWSFKMCNKIKRITGLLMRKMIPDLCSRISFFLKLNSELHGAEKYEILVDRLCGEQLYLGAALNTNGGFGNYKIPISSISLHNSSNVPVT